MSAALKPCPFCGSEVSMTGSIFEDEFYIYHESAWDCQIAEPITINARTREEAIEAWNRRK